MIILYKPNIDDLWFRKKILADDLTMSFNIGYGGTIKFNNDKWHSWYNKWILNHNDKRFYRYIKDTEKNIFVGEAAYYYDAEQEVFMVSIIIYAPYRMKGYGKKALDLICKKAKENGIDSLYDEIALNNPSIAMFTKCGFKKVKTLDKAILVKKVLN